jgi:group II intron reverse transcriptase/maturase
MQTAEAVLEIIHERGKKGLPLDELYRQLYNPHLYLRAYERLRTNKGAMTPGVTEETVDGMSLEKIRMVIEQLRYERFRWTPVRRTYIPKSNGKMRPLGLPTWTDKLVQEVMRSLLEVYYEPQFSDHSHGFRPNRGCHTALQAIQHNWTGTTWWIEGDISQCFDNLDHTVLIAIMRKKILDNRFIRLVEMMITAGYLEEWTYHATYSGSPQGGVVSPLLANVYLDQLDKYVESALLPQHNRGKKHADNPAYTQLTAALHKARRNGDREGAQALEQQRRKLPSINTRDPAYRRLRYMRYADDFLLGYTGPKAEAEEIKADLRGFLKETLHLDLSEEKTLITHARTGEAHFLGYDLHVMHADDKLIKTRRVPGMATSKRRTVNGRVALKVPRRVILAACARYETNGKPIHRPALAHQSEYAIVRKYQAEFRGLVQYYLLATNVSDLNRLRYIAGTSLLKTLANKHHTTLMAMVRKLAADKETPHGRLKCLRVTLPREGKPPLIAEFGGIPLRRTPYAELDDAIPTLSYHGIRTDLLSRLLADTCELCGHKGQCQVHHIRKLADLRRPGKKPLPDWAKHMSAMRRKTMVVCHPCHVAIHAGRPTRQRPMDGVTGEPDAVKVARPVRRGADGKGDQR